MKHVSCSASRNRRATSAVKVAANRANARRSTGPRTDDGKSRSRLNALKHGLCSQAPLLPGDDLAERAQIQLKYEQYYGGASPVEQALAAQAVNLELRLQRLARTEEALAEMDLMDRRAARNDRRDGETMNSRSAAPTADHDDVAVPQPVEKIYARELREQSKDLNKVGPMMLLCAWVQRGQADLHRVNRELVRCRGPRGKSGEPAPPPPTPPSPALVAIAAETRPPYGLYSEADVALTRVIDAAEDELLDQHVQKLREQTAAGAAKQVRSQPDLPSQVAMARRIEAMSVATGMMVPAEMIGKAAGIPESAFEATIANPSNTTESPAAARARRLAEAHAENARLDAEIKAQWEALNREEEIRQKSPEAIAEREMLLAAARLTPRDAGGTTDRTADRDADCGADLAAAHPSSTGATAPPKRSVARENPPASSPVKAVNPCVTTTSPAAAPLRETPRNEPKLAPPAAPNPGPPRPPR